MSDIKNINMVELEKERNMYLKQLLERQNGIMGVIISKPTGKCIGAIENSGKIKHIKSQSNNAASPYNIVVKPSNINIERMLMKNDLHGLAAKDIVIKVMNQQNIKILGQTVNMTGQIVGLIIRIDGVNNYIQTKKSEPLDNIPILAILQKTEKDGAKKDDGKKDEPLKTPDSRTAPAVGPTGAVPVPKPGEKAVQKPATICSKCKNPPPTPAPPAPTNPPADAAAPTTSKLAPSSKLDDANCIEPVECNAKPSMASSLPFALSGVTSKVSNLWKKV